MKCRERGSTTAVRGTRTNARCYSAASIELHDRLSDGASSMTKRSIQQFLNVTIFDCTGPEYMRLQRGVDQLDAPVVVKLDGLR